MPGEKKREGKREVYIKGSMPQIVVGRKIFKGREMHEQMKDGRRKDMWKNFILIKEDG